MSGEAVERACIEVDVLVVGGGPAGLAAAIRLRQLAQRRGRELTVCVLEKGAEIGSHLLSGALFDTRALDELIPDWRERDVPVGPEISDERIYVFGGQQRATRVHQALLPQTLSNDGCHVISLGTLCRWLGVEAERLGVDIFAGFAAAEIAYDEAGHVAGVICGDMGRSRDERPKANFEPGTKILAKYTLFAEGCRGHLGKRLIQRFALDEGREKQHYALGFKELWEIDPAKYRPGTVLHAVGWPLDARAGGSFLYHGANGRVAVGLVVDLDYKNPYFSPFEEFQRFKHHEMISSVLEGGRRIGYGARTIAKGGLGALPRQHFPGGLLIGCDAGTVDFARNKGVHTAMKSGLLAADTVFDALMAGLPGGGDLHGYEQAFKSSWLYDDLFRARNFGPALRRWGVWGGTAFNFIDQKVFGGRLPFTLSHPNPLERRLEPASQHTPLAYPKPDGAISFDRSSSLFYSGVQHEEDQPVHLIIRDPAVMRLNAERYAAPELRYCPAGVYELAGGHENLELRIAAQNCIHCKCCDIKDPAQNIDWVPPEGGGGPNYRHM